MKLFLPILLLSISASAFCQSGPGHNGYRTRIYYKGVQKTKGYKITVSPGMVYAQKMQALYKFKLDSITKYERPVLLGSKYSKSRMYYQLMNYYLNVYSDSLHAQDVRARTVTKK